MTTDLTTRAITPTDLRTTAHIIGMIARDIGNLRHHYARQRELIDGYPNTSAGDRVSHTAELTPTERAAHQLHQLSLELDDIEATLRVIVIGASDVHNTLQHALGRRVAVPICDGRGLEGFHEWGDSCTDPATKAGLCAKHYMRAWRYRRDHHLPPLNESDTQ